MGGGEQEGRTEGSSNSNGDVSRSGVSSFKVCAGAGRSNGCCRGES